MGRPGRWLWRLHQIIWRHRSGQLPLGAVSKSFRGAGRPLYLEVALNHLEALVYLLKLCQLSKSFSGDGQLYLEVASNHFGGTGLPFEAVSKSEVLAGTATGFRGCVESFGGTGLPFKAVSKSFIGPGRPLALEVASNYLEARSSQLPLEAVSKSFRGARKLALEVASRSFERTAQLVIKSSWGTRNALTQPISLTLSLLIAPMHVIDILSFILTLLQIVIYGLVLLVRYLPPCNVVPRLATLLDETQQLLRRAEEVGAIPPQSEYKDRLDR